ncbi:MULTISPECIES: LysR family transcriptional regulator [unclassified Pseudomonas]|uniref:LysR family transcriptional regulator n=1 Tax=unclassified Pseudomonas TaxID=196821 RepID=UPI000D392142|nr:MULTISPECIES: LysR family transcriptional regulator [unclassified Pseudomonas]RAU44636.1 LysR family transcriptional regulator [Pseudomonas sp. RIT 409]RAU54928.1 LysR family transcriptional regulator [Pseudomonas sp. RIT 412]
MKTDLNLLKAFAAVAQLSSFRAAAERLDVTRSAVSQSIRRLEDGLGVSLVQRSTRNVRLTEAGQALYQQTAQALASLTCALDDAALKGPPRGLLKIAVTSIAERFLDGPLIAGFVEAYPEVSLDVTVTDETFDIVERGFDAGVRLGEVIEQDMIAIPVTGEQREMAVASPAYLARHGRPQHPRDLTAHRCIGWRRAPDVAPWRWEFSDRGRAFDVAVSPQITTNDMLLMVRTALADGGITFGIEDTFRPYLERGELVTVLDEYLPPFPGFYLYYPNRHNLAPKLRALVDHVRKSGPSA